MDIVYVSAVKGRLVPRYVTLGPNTEYIGATRKKGKKRLTAARGPKGGSPPPNFGVVYEWDEDKVVAIPASEWRRFRRAYQRALSDGSLKKRTEEQFKAQQKKVADAAKKQADAAAKAARKAGQGSAGEGDKA